MKTLTSDYRPLVPVALPYQGRQLYMGGFDLASPRMPEGYEDYLETVESLCREAGATHGKAYMTVDEKVVEAGMSQRRPRPHVDGCFLEHKMHWGHGGGWNHSCNAVPGRMSVIVASSVPGCRAWRGVFDAVPKSDGDLSHIADILGEGEVLPENIGYQLSPDCIHESMIFEQTVRRSFLRIALPLPEQVVEEI